MKEYESKAKNDKARFLLGILFEEMVEKSPRDLAAVFISLWNIFSNVE